jgi:hypothetical protein
MPVWGCVSLRAVARVGIGVFALAWRGGGERKSPSRARGREGLKGLVRLGWRALLSISGWAFAEACRRLRAVVCGCVQVLHSHRQANVQRFSGAGTPDARWARAVFHTPIGWMTKSTVPRPTGKSHTSVIEQFPDGLSDATSVILGHERIATPNDWVFKLAKPILQPLEMDCQA